VMDENNIPTTTRDLRNNFFIVLSSQIFTD
jgi:hypothetical protein